MNTLVKKSIFNLLILILGVFIGVLITSYKWDYQSTERYCYKCGLTETFESEKSILNPKGKITGKLGSHNIFLSAYLDESSMCSHEWVTYSRFPVKNDRTPEEDMNYRISMIYWYDWNDLNLWPEGQKLLSQMFENNPSKTTELIKKSFNPQNLMSFEDVSGIFKLNLSWEEKWHIWDNFEDNYHVTKSNGTADAVFNNTDSTQIVAWRFRGGDYSRSAITWKHKTP
ncbi:MAG: hypothetical protein PHT69_04490 [Bacteroidales bacterium]|nr:hypothetical protein [Bacteroidales bacterium]